MNKGRGDAGAHQGEKTLDISCTIIKFYILVYLHFISYTPSATIPLLGEAIL